jgi:uncharacterized protein (DUF302 family)
VNGDRLLICHGASGQRQKSNAKCNSRSDYEPQQARDNSWVRSPISATEIVVIETKRASIRNSAPSEWTDDYYECSTVSIGTEGEAMNVNEAGNGIRVLAASGGVIETLDRLENLARKRGMTVFARINFAKDAAAAGLEMQPTQLLILGSPVGGTPLMVAVPGTALDLPLKVLCWQDASNRCWVSFNTPEYLQQRHGFPAALIANIAGLEKLVQAAATASDPA